MSNQTSWWLVPCLGSHALMEAVPRLDKDPLNTISVSTHFAFLRLFWNTIILSTLHHTPGSFSPVAGRGRQPSCQGKVAPRGGTLQMAFSASSSRWPFASVRGKPFSYTNLISSCLDPQIPTIQFDGRIYFVITYYFVLCKYKMFIGNVYSELDPRNESLHQNSSII